MSSYSLCTASPKAFVMAKKGNKGGLQHQSESRFGLLEAAGGPPSSEMEQKRIQERKQVLAREQ